MATQQQPRRRRQKNRVRLRCCNHAVFLRLLFVCLSIIYFNLFRVLNLSSHVVEQQRRSSTDSNNNFDAIERNAVVTSNSAESNTTDSDANADSSIGKEGSNIGNTNNIVNNKNGNANKQQQQQQQFMMIGVGYGTTTEGTRLLLHTTCSLGIPSAHWRWGCLPPKSNQLFLGSNAIKATFNIHERIRTIFNDMRRCIHRYENERKQQNGIYKNISKGCGNALNWKSTVLNLVDQLIIDRDLHNIEAFLGAPYPSLLPRFISTVCRRNIKPIIVLNEIDPIKYVKSQSNKNNGLRDIICTDPPPKIQQQQQSLQVVAAVGGRKDEAGDDDSLKQDSCSSFVGFGGRLDILNCITYAVEKSKYNSAILAHETSSSSLDLVDLFESYDTFIEKKSSSTANNNTSVGIQIIADEMKHYQDSIRRYADFAYDLFTTIAATTMNGGISNKASQKDLAIAMQQHIPALSLYLQNSDGDDNTNDDRKSDVHDDTGERLRHPAILCDLDRGEVIEFGDVPWHKLNNEAKESAIVLGYNQHQWDNFDASIKIFSTPYENLIPKQRAAANYLGLRSYFIKREATIILPSFPLLLDNVLLTDIVWLPNESKLVLIAASPELFRFTTHDQPDIEGLEEITIVDGLPREDLLSPVTLKDGLQVFYDYIGHDNEDVQLRLELKACEEIFSKSGDSNVDDEMYIVHCDIIEGEKMQQQQRTQGEGGINVANADESADYKENKEERDGLDLVNGVPNQLTVYYKSRMVANLQKPTKLNAASSMEFYGRKAQPQHAIQRQSNEGLTSKDKSQFAVSVIIKGVHQYTRHASEIIDYWYKQGISHVYIAVFPTGGYVYDQYKNDDAFFNKYPGFVSIGGLSRDAPTYKNLFFEGWKISYMQSALYHSKTFDDMAIVIDIDEVMTANLNTTTSSIVDILRQIHHNETAEHCYHMLYPNSATTSFEDDRILQRKKFENGQEKREDVPDAWPNRRIVDIWRNRCVGGGKSAYVKSIAVLKNCNFVGIHLHGACKKGTVVGRVPSRLASVLHFTDLWKFRHTLSDNENKGRRYDESTGIGYKRPHGASDDFDALEWKRLGPLVCNKTNEYAVFMESGISFH